MLKYQTTGLDYEYTPSSSSDIAKVDAIILNI